jgi:pantoate--beta-alanine ligase
MSMIVVETIDAVRRELDAVRAAGRSVGLVPTMGYLHEGHVSLMERARAGCDVVAVTIFVNPLQFAADEDLSTYPRDLARDLEQCEGAGVGVVFTPTVEVMYPETVLSTVAVAELGATLEGASRPTHFAGVSTVVAKLFNIVGPAHAYFGMKDYQQLIIVTKMVRDLSFPVTIVPCPIVREPDGLALSSRNIRLTPGDRVGAPVLQRALQAGAAAVMAGQRDPQAAVDLVTGLIEAEPRADLDYVEVVADGTVTRPVVLDGAYRFLVAARFGAVRLIDNLGGRVGGQVGGQVDGHQQ